MSLHITRRGHGPDLALVHGWGLGAGVWQAVAELLAARCRLHLVSLPGYDGSADDGAERADFAATAALLAAALPAGCTLCGWSLGGMLAIAAAVQTPGHFSRLALVGSTASFVQRDGWPAAQPPAMLAAFRAAVAADPGAALGRFVRLFNQGDAGGRAVVRAFAPLLAQPLPATATLFAGLDWLADVDLRTLLAELALPTLLLHGDSDPLMPVAAAETLARRIGCASLQRFAGAAHAPFVSAPETFAATLLAFCHGPA